MLVLVNTHAGPMVRKIWILAGHGCAYASACVIVLLPFFPQMLSVSLYDCQHNTNYCVCTSCTDFATAGKIQAFYQVLQMYSWDLQ